MSLWPSCWPRKVLDPDTTDPARPGPALYYLGTLHGHPALQAQPVRHGHQSAPRAHEQDSDRPYIRGCPLLSKLLEDPESSPAEFLCDLAKNPAVLTAGATWLVDLCELMFEYTWRPVARMPHTECGNC